MLEGGDDTRFIQQPLGHEKLETTANYTDVTITQLQLVYDFCHPAGKLPPDPAHQSAKESDNAAAPTDAENAKPLPFCR